MWVENATIMLLFAKHTELLRFKVWSTSQSQSHRFKLHQLFQLSLCNEGFHRERLASRSHHALQGKTEPGNSKRVSGFWARQRHNCPSELLWEGPQASMQASVHRKDPSCGSQTSAPSSHNSSCLQNCLLWPYPKSKRPYLNHSS